MRSSFLPLLRRLQSARRPLQDGDRPVPIAQTRRIDTPCPRPHNPVGTMETKRRQVVIVGGGFGGLEAAKALAGAPVDVTVVDRTNYHLFQPLLYQVAMAGLSPAEIASPIRGILAEQKNLRVIMGEVGRVDLAERRVHLGDETVDYDWLILAVGAQTSYFGHDAWEKYAPGLKHIEDALEIRRRVLLAFECAEREPD